MEEDNNILDKDFRQGRVHFILSNSYTTFLFAVILGVIFDLVFSYKIFSDELFNYFGVILITLGSILVYWAQSSSSVLEKDENSEIKFNRGPYKYLRSPTHLGIFIMTLGLAMVINSLFSFLFVIIAHIISKIFFVKKQQKILEKKYGETYINYKNKTKDRI
jgi:protein-S-isoprenylcysteine O-methyltransferase Ste14